MPCAAAQLRGRRKSGLPTGLVPTDATSVFRSILTAHQRQHRQLEHLIFGALVSLTDVGDRVIEDAHTPLLDGNVEQMREREPVRADTVDAYTVPHFIFSTSCPVLGITFGAKGLDGGRPAALADDRLPGV